MTTFAQGVARHNNNTRTENGMAALKSSLDPCVDLFFAIGASRGKDITAQFDAAFVASPEIALRCLLWARDIRGGSGERKLFRDMLVHLEAANMLALVEIFHLIPEVGRWDDMLVFKGEEAKGMAQAAIFHALQVDNNGLCAKWMPRKGQMAHELRNAFGWTPKFYRKRLVELSNTVEQLMCAREWNKIDFSKIPSLASARYQKAFGRNAQENYAAYIAKLKSGDKDVKINAGAVYPYDVLKSAEQGVLAVAEAQWKALPNFLDEATGILPVVDVSGSMGCGVNGGYDGSGLSCMDVALSLGLYIADKQKGPFHGVFVSFTDRAEIGVLKDSDSLIQKKRAMSQHVGYSTNVKAVFESVLKVAKQNNVSHDDMPKFILMFSDMQFNGGQVSGQDVGSFQMAKAMFEREGYELPKLIYWNLNARGNNTPVEFDQNGVGLVSGFSPAIMKSILGAKHVTPQDIMAEALMSPRYNLLSQTLADAE